MIKNEQITTPENELLSPREKGEIFLEEKNSKFKEFMTNVFTTGEYDLGYKIMNALGKIDGIALSAIGAKLALAPNPDALVDPRPFGLIFGAMGLSLAVIATMRTAELRERFGKKERQ